MHENLSRNPYYLKMPSIALTDKPMQIWIFCVNLQSCCCVGVVINAIIYFTSIDELLIDVRCDHHNKTKCVDCIQSVTWYCNWFVGKEKCQKGTMVNHGAIWALLWLCMAKEKRLHCVRLHHVVCWRSNSSLEVLVVLVWYHTGYINTLSRFLKIINLETSSTSPLS